MCNPCCGSSLSVLFLGCGKDSSFERNGLFEDNVAIVWISDRKDVTVLIESSEEDFIVWTKPAEELVDKVWFPNLADFIHLQEFSPYLTKLVCIFYNRVTRV